MNNESTYKEQNIQIYDRNSIIVTGIKSVDSFDESLIVATTIYDTRLCLEGEHLIITDVNLQKGSLEAKGLFCGMYYDSLSVSKKSFFSLFKKQ